MINYPFIILIFIIYSCELCTGPKVPDSTADDRQDEESEHKDAPKYDEQGDGRISLDGKEDENMDASDIIQQK